MMIMMIGIAEHGSFGREEGREGGREGGSIGFDQGNRQNGVRSIGSLQFPLIGTDLMGRSNLLRFSLEPR